MNSMDGEPKREVSKALREVLDKYPQRLRMYPDSLPLLLGDYCPYHPEKRYSLCAPMQVARFRAAFVQGAVTRRVVEFVGICLTRDFGFDEKTAHWIQHSWSEALGVESGRQLWHEFTCSNCDHPGEVDDEHLDLIAICPRCKSESEFGPGGEPALIKTGWKRKREGSGEWIFRHRGRRGGSKGTQTFPSHNGEQFSENTLPIVMKAILISMLGDAAIQFESKFTESMPSVVDDPSSQMKDVVAVIAGRLPGVEKFLLFGANDFGYMSASEQWRIPYQCITSEKIKFSNEKSRFEIGEFRSIDVRGFGVPRRKLANVLVALGACAAQFTSHCR